MAACLDRMSLASLRGGHATTNVCSTEAGLVAESVSRPRGDPDWNYMTFFESVKWFTRLVETEETEDGLHECVYLAGHPSLNVSELEDGVYH